MTASGATPMTANNGVISKRPPQPEMKAKPTLDEDESSCGCGPCWFQPLQRCLRPSCFLIFISLLGLFQTMVVTGYSSAILTTIEVRYDFWGSELGLIVSSYDFASTIAGVFVSYYGDRYCRPTWLSRGAFVMCIGSLLWTLPFFINMDNTVIDTNQNDTYLNALYSLCQNEVDLTSDLSENTTMSFVESIITPSRQAMCVASTGSKANRWALPVFMAAFMIVGFGASPVWTLGPTYLYDNTPGDTYPIYAGILYSMGALGPALGFVIAAAILKLYVTPWSTPLGLDDTSPNWVGAWWIGFGISGFLLLVVAIPMGCFPKTLPKKWREDPEETGTPKGAMTNGESKVPKGDDDEIPNNASFGKHLKDFPRHIWSIVCNPRWLFITMALCVEQAIGVGFSRFIAKYLQVIYKFSASSANVMTGCVLIPAAALGVIFGGLLMKKLKLSTKDLTLLLLVVSLLPAAGMGFLLFIGCNNIGVSDMNIWNNIRAENLLATQTPPGVCQTGCSCDSAPYSPVCGADGQTFTSACAAGCHSFHSLNQTFSSCACVNATLGPQSVMPGVCSDGQGCTYGPLFLAVLFVSVFITTGGQTPILIITLRSVNSNIRSFALGVQNFFIQLLVFIPAPIYFGKIFDSQCINRKPSLCDSEGACLVYNEETLRLVFFGAGVGFKLLTMFFLFLSYISFYICSKEKTEDSVTDVTMCNGVSNECVTSEKGVSSESVTSGKGESSDSLTSERGKDYMTFDAAGKNMTSENEEELFSWDNGEIEKTSQEGITNQGFVSQSTRL